MVLLCLRNRNNRSELLKTDQADEAFNVTENETNSFTDIYFQKYYLDLRLLRLTSWGFFLADVFLNKIFLNIPNGLT